MVFLLEQLLDALRVLSHKGDVEVYAVAYLGCSFFEEDQQDVEDVHLEGLNRRTIVAAKYFKLDEAVQHDAEELGVREEGLEGEGREVEDDVPHQNAQLGLIVGVGVRLE